MSSIIVLEKGNKEYTEITSRDMKETIGNEDMPESLSPSSISKGIGGYLDDAKGVNSSPKVVAHEATDSDTEETHFTEELMFQVDGLHINEDKFSTSGNTNNSLSREKKKKKKKKSQGTHNKGPSGILAFNADEQQKLLELKEKKPERRSLEKVGLCKSSTFPARMVEGLSDGSSSAFDYATSYSPTGTNASMLFCSNSFSPKSALRGSYEELGLRSKLHVKWAPDVYEPPCSSASHTLRNRNRKHVSSKKKDDNKHQSKGKSSHTQSCKKKEKQQSLKSREAILSSFTMLPNEKGSEMGKVSLQQQSVFFNAHTILSRREGDEKAGLIATMERAPCMRSDLVSSESSLFLPDSNCWVAT